MYAGTEAAEAAAAAAEAATDVGSGKVRSRSVRTQPSRAAKVTANAVLCARWITSDGAPAVKADPDLLGGRTAKRPQSHPQRPEKPKAVKLSGADEYAVGDMLAVLQVCASSGAHPIQRPDTQAFSGAPVRSRHLSLHPPVYNICSGPSSSPAPVARVIVPRADCPWTRPRDIGRAAVKARACLPQRQPGFGRFKGC